MRKKFIQLVGILFFVLSFSASAKTEIEVCANAQTYSALENIKQYSKIKFKTFYASTDEILSLISNQDKRCHIVISEDEKLPVIMLESKKTEFLNIKRLVRSPLILWSKDENLFDDKLSVIKKKKLKSLAIPRANLSTVGYAASNILKDKKAFPTDYLKHKTYKNDHEYAVFALVDNQNVQAGFITRPVAMRNGKIEGSYHIFNYDEYEPIYYYMTLNSSLDSKVAKDLYNELSTSQKVITSFVLAGFDSLD